MKLFSIAATLLALGSFARASFNQGALNAFRRHLPKRHNQVGDDAPLNLPKLDKRKHSRFLNKNTANFVVNGSAIPEVPFDIGESYAGLLPISESSDEDRELFFWFFPSTNPDAGDEVVIW